MYTVALEPDGILRLEVSGFLDRNAAEKFLADVLAIVPVARRRNGGGLRSLGIALSMPVQMALSLDYFAKIVKAILADPDDRAGLVVRSTLLRLQLARFLPADRVIAFSNEHEARDWLQAPASAGGLPTA